METAINVKGYLNKVIDIRTTTILYISSSFLKQNLALGNEGI